MVRGETSAEAGAADTETSKRIDKKNSPGVMSGLFFCFAADPPHFAVVPFTIDPIVSLNF